MYRFLPFFHRNDGVVGAACRQ